MKWTLVHKFSANECKPNLETQCFRNLFTIYLNRDLLETGPNV